MPQLDLGKVVGDTGPQGPKGDQGIQGPAGQTGPGVAVGGSANQVLVKHSGTNYDTQWVDAGNLPSIAGVQDAIAIVANGDTHPAIASGQFVYVRNHSTLAEGLYKATAAIGTDVALTTSNLTADGSGGLNDLKGQIDSLNSNISDLDNRKGYFTLVNAQLITDAYVTRNTYDNRKFSDYDLIAVTPLINGWIKGTSIVSKNAFLQQTGMEIHTYVGSNPLEVDVKYVSDTSYDSKFIGSPGASVYVFIYGIFAN